MKAIKKMICLCLALLLLGTIPALCASAAQTPAAPQKLKGVCMDGALALVWSRVRGADGYVLLKQAADGSWVYKNKGTPAATSFVDKKVKNGGTYSYRVCAVKNGKQSTATPLQITYLATPQIKSFANRENGIALRWKNYTTAKQYLLYRKTSGGQWSSLAILPRGTTTYLDKNVQPGVKYIYTLRQTSGGVSSAYYAAGFRHVFVSQVTGVSVKNSPAGVLLRWRGVKEAKQYEILRKVPGGKWALIKTVGANAAQFTDANAPFGKQCSYLVRAIRPNNRGANSTAAQLYAVNPKKPMVAVTYDDGPYRPRTNQILDVLQKYNARATFFVVGNRLTTYSDCLQREAALGCEIGCHTYNHTTLSSASNETIQSEISRTNALVKQYSGQTVRLVRAPGGAINSRVQSVVGYPLIQWSVDTRDWENRSVSKTTANVKSHVRDGSIILMHDIHASTASAAEGIVSWLTAQGYQLVTVSEMMDAKGITMQNGGIYYHG